MRDARGRCGRGHGGGRRHERTGLLVPPGDAAALAAAVRRLLEAPGLREAMGAEAARTARERLDGRRMVAETHAWCVEAAARWRELRERATGFARVTEGSAARLRPADLGRSAPSPGEGR